MTVTASRSGIYDITFNSMSLSAIELSAMGWKHARLPPSLHLSLIDAANKPTLLYARRYSYRDPNDKWYLYYAPKT